MVISRIDAMKLVCAARPFLMLRDDCLVATGAVFEDGTAVLRWRGPSASTAIYRSLEELKGVHGHEGTAFEHAIEPSRSFKRGHADCAQDACENAPFASVGGMDARKDMMRPHWISESDWPEYLRGYQVGAALCHGDGWEDANFGWSPALTLGEEEAE
jgi:hypothetical protein